MHPYSFAPTAGEIEATVKKYAIEHTLPTVISANDKGSQQFNAIDLSTGNSDVTLSTDSEGTSTQSSQEQLTYGTDSGSFTARPVSLGGLSLTKQDASKTSPFKQRCKNMLAVLRGKKQKAEGDVNTNETCEHDDHNALTARELDNDTTTESEFTPTAHNNFAISSNETFDDASLTMGSGDRAVSEHVNEHVSECEQTTGMNDNHQDTNDLNSSQGTLDMDETICSVNNDHHDLAVNSSYESFESSDDNKVHVELSSVDKCTVHEEVDHMHEATDVYNGVQLQDVHVTIEDAFHETMDNGSMMMDRDNSTNDSVRFEDNEVIQSHEEPRVDSTASRFLESSKTSMGIRSLDNLETKFVEHKHTSKQFSYGPSIDSFHKNVSTESLESVLETLERTAVESLDLNMFDKLHEDIEQINLRHEHLDKKVTKKLTKKEKDDSNIFAKLRGSVRKKITKEKAMERSKQAMENCHQEIDTASRTENPVDLEGLTPIFRSNAKVTSKYDPAPIVEVGSDAKHVMNLCDLLFFGPPQK